MSNAIAMNRHLRRHVDAWDPSQTSPHHGLTL